MSPIKDNTIFPLRLPYGALTPRSVYFSQDFVSTLGQRWIYVVYVVFYPAAAKYFVHIRRVVGALVRPKPEICFR